MLETKPWHNSLFFCCSCFWILEKKNVQKRAKKNCYLLHQKWKPSTSRLFFTQKKKMFFKPIKNELLTSHNTPFSWNFLSEIDWSRPFYHFSSFFFWNLTFQFGVFHFLLEIFFFFARIKVFPIEIFTEKSNLHNGCLDLLRNLCGYFRYLQFERGNKEVNWTGFLFKMKILWFHLFPLQNFSKSNYFHSSQLGKLALDCSKFFHKKQKKP